METQLLSSDIEKIPVPKASAESVITWVSDFDQKSLEELREFLWRFQPGDITKLERPDKREFSFPDAINILSLGPARSGKSSYMNSLMSIVNPNAEVIQIHSELGTDNVTGSHLTHFLSSRSIGTPID